MAQAEKGKDIYLTQHYSGNGRGMSTGRLLPPDWRIVRVTIKKVTGDTIILEIQPIVKE